MVPVVGTCSQSYKQVERVSVYESRGRRVDSHPYGVVGQKNLPRDNRDTDLLRSKVQGFHRLSR